jgi:hypothetical protein
VRVGIVLVDDGGIEFRTGAFGAAESSLNVNADGEHCETLPAASVARA